MVVDTVQEISSSDRRNEQRSLFTSEDANPGTSTNPNDIEILDEHSIVQRRKEDSHSTLTPPCLICNVPGPSDDTQTVESLQSRILPFNDSPSFTRSYSDLESSAEENQASVLTKEIRFQTNVLIRELNDEDAPSNLQEPYRIDYQNKSRLRHIKEYLTSRDGSEFTLNTTNDHKTHDDNDKDTELSNTQTPLCDPTLQNQFELLQSICPQAYCMIPWDEWYHNRTTLAHRFTETALTPERWFEEERRRLQDFIAKLSLVCQFDTRTMLDVPIEKTYELDILMVNRRDISW